MTKSFDMRQSKLQIVTFVTNLPKHTSARLDDTVYLARKSDDPVIKII